MNERINLDKALRRLSLTRRSFLQGAAASAAAAALVRVPGALAAPAHLSASAPRALQDVQVVDVTSPQFGAVGDGVHDDREAFQAAINAAIEAKLPLWIPVPAQFYRINVNANTRFLDVAGDLSVLGAGRDTCLIRFSIPNPDPTKVYAGWMVRNGISFQMSEVRLEEDAKPTDFEIQGVFIETGPEDHRVVIENVNVTGFTQCIYSPSSGVGDSKGELFLTLRNCDLQQSRMHCLAFWAVEEGHKRLHIYDSYIHDNQNSHLVYCHPHNSVHCENTRFNTTNGWAFHFQGSAVAGDPEYQRFVGCWFGPYCSRGIITQDRVDTYTQVEVRNCIFECRPSIQIRSDIVIDGCYFTTPANPPMGTNFIGAYSNTPWKAEIVNCVFAPQSNSLPMVDLRLEKIEVAIRGCQFYNQGSATIITLGKDATNRFTIEDCLFSTRTTNGAQSIVFEVSDGVTLIDRCRFVGRATGDRGVFTMISTDIGPSGDTRFEFNNCQFENISGGSLVFVQTTAPYTWTQRIFGANNVIQNYQSTVPLLRSSVNGQGVVGPTGVVGYVSPTPGTPTSSLPAGPVLVISSNYDTYSVTGIADVNAIHWWSADGASDSLFSGTITLTAANGFALVPGGNINLNGAVRRDVAAGQSLRLFYDPAQGTWVEVTA